VFRALGLAALLLCSRGVCAEEPPVRDPMRPFARVASAAGAASVSGPRFALTGVLIGPTRRVAIVNGKPYAQGETVDGAEIVAVEPGAVRLREHGAELVISLGRAAEPRPSAAERRPLLVQGETVP
jgi:hypothetical protein